MTFIKMRVGGDVDEIQRRLKQGSKLNPKAMKMAVMKVAHSLRTRMIDGLKSGAPGGKKFAPNSPWTVAMKGSSKPLIDSGAMLNSIVVVNEGNGVFVGIKRTSASKGVNLALLHETGAVIKQIVTPNQRRFFLAITRKIFGKARAPAVGAQLVIRIPARPFVTPVLEKYATEWMLSRDILDEFDKNTGRIYDRL